MEALRRSQPTQPSTDVARSGGNLPQVGYKVVAIAAWYPVLDFTQPREDKISRSLRPDKALPKLFTELFDASYMYPENLDRACPWLSPGVAPSSITGSLPEDIILYTCEWDMLLDEAEQFRDRLTRDFPEKRVSYRTIPGVTHGFDKAPNPIRWESSTEDLYKDACMKLRAVFYGEPEKR
jgi:putative ergosteryl-3beta-O-L-aspartate hydrolase